MNEAGDVLFLASCACYEGSCHIIIIIMGDSATDDVLYISERTQHAP